MASLQEQLQKAKKLQRSSIQDDLYKFIRSIETQILDSEKNRIFNESKDIFGNPLGFYSKATEIITKGQKKAGEPFTGKDTGNWFAGFKMQEVAGVLRFYSTDPKTNDILNGKTWLSHEVFGLSDKDLKAIIENQLLPFILQNTRKILDV